MEILFENKSIEKTKYDEIKHRSRCKVLPEGCQEKTDSDNTRSFKFSSITEYNKIQEDFKDETKKSTVKSSLMQTGLFAGALISKYYISSSKDLFASQYIHHFILFSAFIPDTSVDFVSWRTMSLFAGFFGFAIYLCYLLFFKESVQWKEIKSSWKDRSKKYKKYLEVLEEIENWLVMEKLRLEDGNLNPGILKLLENKKYRYILEEISDISAKTLDLTSLRLLDNNKKYLEVLEEIEKSIQKVKLRLEDGNLNPGILKLLENKKYKKIVFGFWLILSGLMYMYYSTVVMAPELLLRDDKFIGIWPFNLVVPFPGVFWTISFLLIALLSHMMLGFFLHGMWDYKKNGKVEKYQTLNDKNRIKYLSNILNSIRKSQKIKFRLKIIYSIAIVAYAFKIITSFIISKILGKNEDEDKDEVKKLEEYKKIFLQSHKPESIDILSIIGIGFIILIIGIIGSILFFFYYSSINLYVLVFTAFAILMANSGWALVPSMLASRFPTHYRATGSSLAYNGGLAISFASPFIIMEFYLRYQNEYVIFIAMILGAISMLTGAALVIKTENEIEEISPKI